MPSTAQPRPRPRHPESSLFAAMHRRNALAFSIPLCTAAAPQSQPSATSPRQPSFKVGLCMAGAASGGAYSAGVMDYLWEAMLAWEKEKNDNPASVPPWSVAISDITGTSAGGVTATLGLSALNTPYTPLPRDYDPDLPDNNLSNPLFRTWVSKFHYESVFKTDDLDSQPKDNRVVRSLFNSEFISRTSVDVLQGDDISPKVPSWAEDLIVTLTATNMSGIPYAVDSYVSNVDGDAKFHMTRHADYTQFRATTNPSSVTPEEKERMYVVDMTAPRNTASWKHLIDCSMATAAYPVGLPSVKLEAPRSFYENRLAVAPEWDYEGDVLEYNAVDGGVLNNDPFGILEKQMTRHGNVVVAEGKSASGSILLVDPFPKEAPDPPTVQEGLPIIPTILSMIQSIRQDAMFKEDQFKACLQVDNMSRFLVRPDRDVSPGQRFQLATNTLGTFGGIIDERIRLHDFQLGRLNCKYFLENTFVIKREDALENPIFKNYPEFLKEEYIPIIPVVGKAAQPINEPQWPTFSESEKKKVIEKVSQKAQVRMSKIIDIYAANLGIVKQGGIGQWLMNRAFDFVKGRLEERLNERIVGAISNSMSIYDSK